MKIKSIFVSLTIAATFSQTHAQETSRLETKARQYLSQNASKVGLASAANLKLDTSRKSLSGETLRFDQYVNDVPVFNGDIAVHFNRQDEITYVAETTSTKSLKKIDTIPAISSEKAFEKAKSASEPKGDIVFQENKLYVYTTENGDTKLVYRIIIDSFEKQGSWETLIDAHSGDVISVKDIANYHNHDHKKKKKKNGEEPKPTVKEAPKKASGTAYIYDPDPLSVAQVAYGGNYVDNDDATNASLDAARSLVTLPDIELLSGVYKLKNSYVEIRELQSPATGLFTQSTPDFLFNRFDQGFEAVNVFYHFNKSLKYINETLGISCKPTINNGVVLYDPHGFSGADNSAFYPSGGYLVFGEGGVDDAEDADVVLHELGHGIHHWVSGNKSSSAQGLGEGSGDYWAMSYSRSLNQWPSNTPQYNWVFSWDGHNPFWAGRVTNYATKYTTSISNTANIHRDGQIWATCLMRIYDIIGKEKTDRIFLEGLGMTNTSSNQQTAAVAVRQAAIDMLGTYGFTCADVNTITAEMTTTGYTLPAYTCTFLAANEVKRPVIKLYPNPAKDVLNLSIDIKDSKNGTITTMDGRKVKDIKINSGANQIDITNLTKGVYLLNVNGEVQKFIKE